MKIPKIAMAGKEQGLISLESVEATRYKSTLKTIDCPTVIISGNVTELLKK